METSNKDKAKKYMRRRIAVETTLAHSVKELILAAFARAAVLCYGIKAESFSMNTAYGKRIKSISANLKSSIGDMLTASASTVVVLSDSKNSHKSGLDPSSFLDEQYYGSTARERLQQHCGHLLGEWKLWLAAMLQLKMSVSETSTLYRSYFTKPYSNPVIAAARKSAGGVRLPDMPSQLTGRYTGAAVSIDRLVRNTIERCYTEADFMSWTDMGITFVMVERGSSYPCSLCDSMTGVHPCDDIMQLPPYHPRCCCICYPLGGGVYE